MLGPYGVRYRGVPLYSDSCLVCYIHHKQLCTADRHCQEQEVRRSSVLATSKINMGSSPHTVNGFADDITIISPSLPAHNCMCTERGRQKTMTRTTAKKKTASLDLRLKPEKMCVIDEKKTDKKSTVPLPMVPLKISQKQLVRCLDTC